MKIIDGHAHVCEYINGYGARGELRALGAGYAEYSDGLRVKMIPDGMGEKGCTPETLLGVMDLHGVEKAVLLQGMYLGFQNSYTMEAVRKYPSRFTGAATFDPFARNRNQIIHHLFDELGFGILKMEVSNTSGLMCNHETVDLDGSLMHEVYQMAEERGLVFVIDIGRPGNDCWQVENLSRAISRHPLMKFVICHLASHPIDRGSLLNNTLHILKLPNVWFDLASVPNNTKPEEFPYPTALSYVMTARDLVGADRLIWGSDMPCGIVRDTYAHNIEYLLDSGEFSESELKKIFHDNAEAVYFTRKNG